MRSSKYRIPTCINGPELLGTPSVGAEHRNKGHRRRRGGRLPIAPMNITVRTRPNPAISHDNPLRFPRRIGDFLRRASIQEPARLPAVQPRRTRRGQDHARAPAFLGRRTGTPSAAPAATPSAPARCSARGMTGPPRWKTRRPAHGWPSSSSKNSARLITRSTTATSPRKATRSPRPTAISMRWSPCSKRNRRARASGCSGARRVCSPTRVSSTARPPARTRRCSPTPPRR